MEEDSKQPKTNYLVTPYGIFDGHQDWVTKICVSSDPETLVTASRDKSVLIWKLTTKSYEVFGKIKSMLVGHNHFISDCAVSKDGDFLITSSWDKTMRLWDINRGATRRVFVGHTNDVMSVSFSNNNRQIVSGSRDRTVRLWNTLAMQKYVFEEDGHKDCVTSVLTLPTSSGTTIISGGWDRVIKIWSLRPPGCASVIQGHQNVINSLSTCPNNRLLASGSKDGTVNVWNLPDKKLFHTYTLGGDVGVVCFNPRYRILAATNGEAVQLYDLGSHELIKSVLPSDTNNIKTKPMCTTITWSNNGDFLFAGYSDGKVRAYFLSSPSD